jgi:hypothetical protein
MLKLAQKYYLEPRLLKISGAGSQTSMRRFNQADLQGGVNISVETGSALPRTRAGRQARILEYVDRGVIRPDQAYKYLDIADLEGLASKFKADEDQAYREHDKLINGGTLNEIAGNMAIQAIQAGQVPGPDGQPLQDMQQIQSFIEQETLRPFTFENYSVHLDIHSQFMKSPEFESLPSEVKNQFLTHYNLTMEAMNNLPKPLEFQPVRPTLQIKATAGPTPISKILDKAGVTVTPEEMAEPPLETWVTDSMDKPDVDEAGNDPLTQMDVALKQQEIQAKLADAAIRSNQFALASMHEAEAHNQKAVSSDQKDMHDAEMHEIKLREQAAKAALAEKKAAQSDFRPKPPSKKGSK